MRSSRFSHSLQDNDKTSSLAIENNPCAKFRGELCQLRKWTKTILKAGLYVTHFSLYFREFVNFVLFFYHFIPIQAIFDIILGPLLILVNANDISSYTSHESSIALFEDNTKLYYPIDSVSSVVSPQADLD